MKRPSFSPKDRLDTFKAYGAIVCCQAEGCDSAIYISDAEIDHHVALIDDGKHELSNWRPVCSACHRKKSALEHKANSRAKRLAAARAIHEAAKRGEHIRPPSRLKGKGFDKSLRKRMNGQTEKRT